MSWTASSFSTPAYSLIAIKPTVSAGSATGTLSIQGSGSGTLGANGNVTNTKPASGVDLISKALNAKK